MYGWKTAKRYLSSLASKHRASVLFIFEFIKSANYGIKAKIPAVTGIFRVFGCWL
jgi:hypothetical protein